MAVQRALISVFDKNRNCGICEAAGARKIEILSTGGTANCFEKRVSRCATFPISRAGPKCWADA